MQTLSYEAKAAPRVFVPPPRWMQVLLAVGSILILAALLIALPPLAGALDYTRDIPVSEAIGYALGADWGEVLTHPWTTGLVCLIPLEVGAVVTYALSRRAWLTRSAFWTGVIAPFMCAGRFAPFLPLISVFTLPAWLGQEDGEGWSEGFVAFGTAGMWSVLWLAGGGLMLLRGARSSRQPTHHGINDSASR